MTQDSAGPLSGLNILDLSRVLAGPYCTQIFADHGAHVIKVESPQGDDTRRFGPPFVAGESTYFMSVNRGKQSLVLDLKQPQAVAIIHRLAAWADVVLENFRPGVADRLGVGAKDLCAINDRLVYASISGYGHRGEAPYTTMPGYDLVAQGMGGIAALTGPADGAPHKMGTSVADLVSGLNAYGGIMTALWARERTGRGQVVDVSMLEGQLSLLSYHASAWLNAEKMPRRMGNAHPSICPYETFETQDGYLNIACGNDKQFQRLCGALALPHLAEDERFATNAQRVAHRRELLMQLRPIIASDTSATWSQRIDSAGVPCGPVQEVPEALAHPQVAARDLLVHTTHPSAGTVRGVGSAMGMAKSSYNHAPPPTLGEHSVQVLKEVLGLAAPEVQALLESGAVVQA